MSDKTIRLVVDLTYNADIMHGDCEDSIEWFKGILHGDNLHLSEFGDLGDIIGPVKVIAELTSSEAANGKSKDARIEELEAELAEYKHVASAIDTQWAESQDEIADLKDKLVKAVDALGEAIYLLDPDEEDIAKETGLHRIVTTYAELTGGKDD